MKDNSQPDFSWGALAGALLILGLYFGALWLGSLL